MKKIIKLSLIASGVIFIIFIIAFALSSSDKSKTNDLTDNSKEQGLGQKTESNIEVLSDEEKLKELQSYSKSLLGGSFIIQQPKLESDKAIIVFDTDIKIIKQNKPESKLDTKTIKDYWENNNQIIRVLNDGSVRLMKKFNFINSVDMIVNNNNKIYRIEVSKSNLEEFTNMSFEEITSNWDNFTNKYVKDKNGSESFYNHFNR